MIEYRVKEVKRYIVTRFHRDEMPDGQEACGIESVGEYANENQAGWVAGLMAHSECAIIEDKWKIQFPSVIEEK